MNYLGNSKNTERVNSMKLRGLLLVLFACANFLLSLDAQNLPATELYTRSEDSLELDSLRLTYGQNKTIPKEIELQALRALSHYPELKAIKVRFKWYKNKTAHSSRPNFGTILRRKSKRTYVISVSTEVPNFYLLGMQKNLPYNAQVGVLGHELGHTIQYLEMRFFGLLGMGIKYSLSKKAVIKTEHATDHLTIAHGLGWQLLAWAQIAHPLLVQAGRGQNYLHPEEIEEVIKKTY